ncbi:MAG: cytochrome c [Gemmatimonadaceae bacterium]
MSSHDSDLPASKLLTKLRRFTLWTGALFLLAVVVGAIYLAVRLTDDEPVEYAAAEDHFKYGSTGGERGWKKQFGFGIPYWVWVALPELFPQYLPDGKKGRGYASFGMIYTDGRNPRFELPVGMSMRRVQGIDRVYFNCAVCHTGSVRTTPDADPQIVLGMPANTFDFGALGMFLSRTSTDWRFRADRVFPKIEELESARDSLQWPTGRYRPDKLNVVDRLVFRYAGVTVLREQLLTLTSRLAFIDFSTWGPGRVDTFNPPKALLGFPMDSAPAGEKLGNADFPAVWNQEHKEGMQLHWDGNNNNVDERNLSAGFGTGATPTTLDEAKITRVARYLDSATAPAYPSQHLDGALASQGEPIYRAACFSCHGDGKPPFRRNGDGSLVGKVTPIASVGTDRARLDSYTPVLAAAQNSLYAGYPRNEADCADAPRYMDRCYPARFSHFTKTWGYANMPLDGLWLRAPYLHNGSVPDLRALLEPAAARPKVFYIGYDVYDYERVGFVTDSARVAGKGWRFDTNARGNGNGGHEYGVNLTPAQKTALVEYLKTF